MIDSKCIYYTKAEYLASFQKFLQLYLTVLSTLDIVIIICYFLVLLLVGWLTGRNESKEDFLIGGRSVKAFQSLATIGSSLVGAGVLLTYTALAVLYGAGAIWLFVGYIFGFWLFYAFARYLKPLADEQGFYTLPDFFYFKFGGLAGRLSALLVVLITLGWIVVNFIGGGSIIQAFTGLSYKSSTVIVGAVIVLYLFFGGFKAVVKTDVIQFIGICLLFVLMLYLLFTQSFHLTPHDLNAFKIPAFEIASFFIVGLITPMASAELWQRVYAVESTRVLRKSIVGLTFFLILFGVVLLLIGLVIRNAIPNVDADTALVTGFANLLPAGWAGLAVVVFYSSIMSSADTYLFTANASLSQDLIHRKESKGTSIVKKSKSLLFLTALITVGLAIFIHSVVDATYLLVALMIALGFLVMIIWLRRKWNSGAIVLALAFGITSVLLGVLIHGIETLVILYSVIGTLAGLILGELGRNN